MGRHWQLSRSTSKNLEVPQSTWDEPYYRIMATINDGLLRGPPAPEANPASTGWFVHRLMALAQEELATTGDRCQLLQKYFQDTSRDWMVDIVSGASVRLADILPTSRRVAASFSRLNFTHWLRDLIWAQAWCETWRKSAHCAHQQTRLLLAGSISHQAL